MKSKRDAALIVATAAVGGAAGYWATRKYGPSRSGRIGFNSGGRLLITAHNIEAASGGLIPLSRGAWQQPICLLGSHEARG